MDSINNKIKEIKFDRTKPEEKFLWYIINELVPSEHNCLPDQVVLKYLIDGVVIFSYDRRFKQLWYNFDKIYLKLSYHLNDKDLEDFIRLFLSKHLIKEDIIYVQHGSTRSSHKIWKQ